MRLRLEIAIEWHLKRNRLVHVDIYIYTVVSLVARFVCSKSKWCCEEQIVSWLKSNCSLGNYIVSSALHSLRGVCVFSRLCVFSSSTSLSFSFLHTWQANPWATQQRHTHKHMWPLYESKDNFQMSHTHRDKRNKSIRTDTSQLSFVHKCTEQSRLCTDAQRNKDLTCEWVTSHIWAWQTRAYVHDSYATSPTHMRHVRTCTVRTCMTHVWHDSFMRHVTHMDESCHTHEWVMPYVCFVPSSRVTKRTSQVMFTWLMHMMYVFVSRHRLFSTLLIHMHETRRICSFHNTTQGHKTDVAQIRPMHESTWLMSISWHTNPTHEPCHFAYVHFETREDVTHKTDMCPCRVHSVSCVTKTLCVCHENVACPFCVSRTRCVSVSCVTKTWHTKRHISSSWHISWHITRATWHTQRTQESCHFGMTDSHMWQNSFVCDMSRTKVTNEWVMSRVNESCHIWMRHATYMTRSNVTWLIRMLHDSFIRGMFHS